MKLGGNRKFLEFMLLYGFKDSLETLNAKYNSKACELYREELDQVMNQRNTKFRIDRDRFLEKLPLVEGQLPSTAGAGVESLASGRRNSVFVVGAAHQLTEDSRSMFQELSLFS